jgi:hypothetical protein
MMKATDARQADCHQKVARPKSFGIPFRAPQPTPNGTKFGGI